MASQAQIPYLIFFFKKSAPSVLWIFRLFGKPASLPFWVVFRVKPPFCSKKGALRE
jgi:hypothetical protein